MGKRVCVLAAVLMAAGVAAKVCRADEAKKDAAPAAAAKADEKKADAAKAEAPEFLEFKQTGKMASVKFPHKAHADRLKGCKECHEGEKPLFPKKFDDAKGMKMADLNKGEFCGTCHNGTKEVDGKKVFATKMGCLKCHKKAEAEKK